MGSNLTGGVDCYAGSLRVHFVLCRYCANSESRVALGLIVSLSVLVWCLPGVLDKIFVHEFFASVVLSLWKVWICPLSDVIVFFDCSECRSGRL